MTIDVEADVHFVSEALIRVLCRGALDVAPAMNAHIMSSHPCFHPRFHPRPRPRLHSPRHRILT